MSSNSKIEWTQGDDGTPGATWNPVTGCVKVSPGCDHCYAETFAERWRGIAGHHFENGFDVTLRPERLGQPLRWRKPRRIFVNSMSDLFHEAVPDEFIAEVFAVMSGSPQHTYQVLTKRHARMRSLLSSPDFRAEVARCAGRRFENGDLMHDQVAYRHWPLPNVWLGVSVEDQKWADIRIPALLKTPAAVRFLSCEPLLGPVDLDRWMPAGTARWHCGGCRTFFSGEWQQVCPRCDRMGYWSGSHVGNGHPGGQPLSWIICGGESGPKARPMHPAWARQLRDQSAAASVPFFFKQWGAHRWVEHSRYDEATQCWVADGIEPQRVSKALAGRELDGREWNEFPVVAKAAA